MKKLKVTKRIKFYLQSREEKKTKKEMRKLKSVLMNMGLLKRAYLAQEAIGEESASN